MTTVPLPAAAVDETALADEAGAVVVWPRVRPARAATTKALNCIFGNVFVCVL